MATARPALQRASLSIVLALWAGPAVPAQSFKASDLAPAKTPNSQAARPAGLDAILHNYWQWQLERAPELASAIGDDRFDDRLADDSPEAYNQALARGEELLERLGAIDSAGLTAEERSRKQLLVEKLVDQQESADCSPWQTPVTATSGPQIELPELIAVLPFRTAEDYDHYIARLNEIPAVFLQVGTDMMLGEQAGRIAPAARMQKALEQVNAVASAKPEQTPFARPLDRLPGTFPAAQQAEIRGRVLGAIRTRVQPAYTHFAKFLHSEYILRATASAASTDCRTPLHAETLQVLELRTQAQKALGKRFDLQAFHDEILQRGAVPPDILDQRIHRWIALHATK